MIKKLSVSLLTFWVVFCISFSVFSQTNATTADGKKVILNSNGTWQYLETTNSSKFIGTWKGDFVESQNTNTDKSEFIFTITQENGKFRIKVLNTANNLTDNGLGTYKDGKITRDGNEKDFYKYQIPTLEFLPNGDLMHSDGGGNIRLKKVQ